VVPGTDDAEARRLAHYMIRCPLSLEKMRYDGKSQKDIYPSRLRDTLKRNYQFRHE
jgi:hypothetical protein